MKIPSNDRRHTKQDSDLWFVFCLFVPRVSLWPTLLYHSIGVLSLQIFGFARLCLGTATIVVKNNYKMLFSFPFPLVCGTIAPCPFRSTTFIRYYSSESNIRYMYRLYFLPELIDTKKYIWIKKFEYRLLSNADVTVYLMTNLQYRPMQIV